MFDFFKTQKAIAPSLHVDMHSHLLPGIDDGVKSWEESLTLIKAFQTLGYRKLIITPHVISDIYRNTDQILIEKHAELRLRLEAENIEIETKIAAEYYLDESLMQRMNAHEPFLTFGDKYLLFETNFLSEPFFLKEFIFIATTIKYQLVLAHPERYLYLQDNLSKAEDLLSRGVLFQVNINSLGGYYSKAAQSFAIKLIERGWVHFLGSDCHHEGHITLVSKLRKHKYMQKALNLSLLNNSL